MQTRKAESWPWDWLRDTVSPLSLHLFFQLLHAHPLRLRLLAGGGCGFRQPLRPHLLRLYWVGTGLSAALGSTVHHSSRVSSSLLIPIYEISGKIQVVSSMSLQGIVCIRDAAIYVLRHKVPSGMWQGSSAGKESTWNAGDSGSIPGSGRAPGKGIGCPLQYSWVSLVAQPVKNPPTMREN